MRRTTHAAVAVLLLLVVLTLAAGCTDDGGTGAPSSTGAATTSTRAVDTSDVEPTYPAPFEPCDTISEQTVTDAVGTTVSRTGIATGSVVDGVETDGCTWTGDTTTATVQVLAPPDPAAYVEDVVLADSEVIDDADLDELPVDAVAVRFAGQPETDRIVVPSGDHLLIVGVVVDGDADLELAATLAAGLIDAS